MHPLNKIYIIYQSFLPLHFNKMFCGGENVKKNAELLFYLFYDQITFFDHTILLRCPSLSTYSELNKITVAKLNLHKGFHHQNIYINFSIIVNIRLDYFNENF